MTFLKKRFINKKDFFITQTYSAKKAIINNYKISEQKVFVVHNSFKSPKRILKKINIDNKINILALASPYIHKNLDIIPDVIKALKKLCNLDVNFHVTIPNWNENSSTKRFLRLTKEYKLEKNIINHGKVLNEDIIKLYKICSITFIPTLFEVFSVTFLESFSFKIPVVTSNIEQTKEICGDAALYFKSMDPLDAADRILQLHENDITRKELINEGLKILKKYNFELVMKNHLHVLKNIINEL